MTGTRAGDAGFTVLELVIVLTIVSLVAAALGSVLHTGRLAMRAAGDAAGRVEELWLVRRVVGEALSQLPVGEPMTGNSRSLTVTAWGPRVLAAASPIRLSVGPDMAGSGLMAAWHTGPGEAGVAQPTRYLMSPARSVRLIYYAADSGWSDELTANKPPSVVRLLISDRNDNRHSASLSFQVRRLAAGPCRLPKPNAACGALQ